MSLCLGHIIISSYFQLMFMFTCLGYNKFLVYQPTLRFVPYLLRLVSCGKIHIFQKEDRFGFKMPSSNNIDMDLLGKLYRVSEISNIKRTDIKKTKWQEIAMQYCSLKNVPLMDHRTLLRKWSKVVTSARKKRAISELSMKYSTAADLDIGSDFDCEPNRRIVRGELNFITIPHYKWSMSMFKF